MLTPRCERETSHSFVTVLQHWKTCVFGAHERTLAIPCNAEDLETVEITDMIGAIAEDQHVTQCAQVCSTSAEEDRAEQHD